LMNQITPTATIASINATAIQARNNLEFFTNQVQGLPLSKNAATAIIANLDKIHAPENLRQPDTILTEQELNLLNYSIFNFQAVLASELPQANIFYITPKLAYDMTILINKGENLLSKNTLNSLGISKEDVINDIREATKCLAFDIPTAVGFHVYRAVEAIIVKDYFPVMNIPLGKSKNLGNYIKLLEDHNADERVTIILKHLKDYYRNPISHPEEFWDSNTSESAFGLAISVINVMVKNIEDIKLRLATPTP